MDTSQEVYENIDTDELSHSISSVKNETLMQDVERSVDIEEVQDITDSNSYDDIDFDFLPRKHISRYTKLFANFDVNVFERFEFEPEQSTDNDSDDS
ncbi:2762_t:CDS:1, partial [Funneliformis caledonium]